MCQSQSRHQGECSAKDGRSNGSPEWPSHGGGGHSGALLDGEEDSDVWATPVMNGDGSVSNRCTRERQTWLLEQLDSGGSTTEKLSAKWRCRLRQREERKEEDVTSIGLCGHGDISRCSQLLLERGHVSSCASAHEELAKLVSCRRQSSSVAAVANATIHHLNLQLPHPFLLILGANSIHSFTIIASF